MADYILVSDNTTLDEVIEDATVGTQTFISAKLIETIAISEPKTIPANLFIKPVNGAKFSKATGARMIFMGPGIDSETRVPIFSGFSPGDIVWRGVYHDRILPEWFGIKANDTSNAAANSAAWKVLEAAFQSSDYGDYFSGGTVLFGNGTYWFSEVLQINQGTKVKGKGFNTILRFPSSDGIRVNGGMTRGITTVLDDALYQSSASNATISSGDFLIVTVTTPLPTEFLYGYCYYSGGNAVAKKGVIWAISNDGLTVTINTPVNSVDTWSVPYAAATGATLKVALPPTIDYPEISDLTVYGDDAGPAFTQFETYAPTHTVSVSTATINGVDEILVTKLTGEAFDYRKRYMAGLTMSIANVPYVIKTLAGVVAPSTSSNTLILHPYRVKIRRTAASTYELTEVAIPSNGSWAGGKIKIEGREYPIATMVGNIITVSGGDPIPFVLPDSYTGIAAITKLPSANFTDKNAFVAKRAGIDVRNQCKISQVQVSRFSGTGILLDSEQSPSMLQGGQPNANWCEITNVHLLNNYTGIRCVGGNSNTNKISNVNCQLNSIAIYDNPQHANEYYQVHTNLDNQGIMMGYTSLQGSTIFGLYTEGAPPTLDLAGSASVIGGTFDYITPYSSGGAVLKAFNKKWRGAAYEAVWKPDTGIRGGNIGTNSMVKRFISRLADISYASFLTFGEYVGEDTDGFTNGMTRIYKLVNAITGWYGFSYTDSGAVMDYAGDAYYNAPLEFSTTDSPVGGGEVRLNGFIIGEKTINGVVQTRPAASADWEGKVWITKAGSGVATKLSICLKGDDNNYHWYKYSMTLDT